MIPNCCTVIWNWSYCGTFSVDLLTGFRLPVYLQEGSDVHQMWLMLPISQVIFHDDVRPIKRWVISVTTTVPWVTCYCWCYVFFFCLITAQYFLSKRYVTHHLLSFLSTFCFSAQHNQLCEWGSGLLYLQNLRCCDTERNSSSLQHWRFFLRCYGTSQREVIEAGEPLQWHAGDVTRLMAEQSQETTIQTVNNQRFLGFESRQLKHWRCVA